MNYAYSNSGMSCRLVETAYTAASGEVLFDHVPSPAELTTTFPGYALAAAAASRAATNAPVQAQIDALLLQLNQPLANLAIANSKSDSAGATAALAAMEPINTEIAALQAQLAA